MPKWPCTCRYGFQTEDHLCLVLDYIEGGNMYSDLMRGPYTHERACYYAAQIVLATQHLHELNILYRDLKPDNVLLTHDGFIKLADMGAARGRGGRSGRPGPKFSPRCARRRVGRSARPGSGPTFLAGVGRSVGDVQ